MKVRIEIEVSQGTSCMRDAKVAYILRSLARDIADPAIGLENVNCAAFNWGEIYLEQEDVGWVRDVERFINGS
jgi:hypothetical protein